MLARCAARGPGTTTRRAVPLAAHHVGVGLPRRKSGMHAPARRSGVIVRAEADDLDSMLIAWADKWEAAENKPIVVAYLSGAVIALFVGEWLIHLPALNILLGFPIQLLGLVMLPYLGVRWFVDGKKASADIGDATGYVVSKLPGLKKE